MKIKDIKISEDATSGSLTGNRLIMRRSLHDEVLHQLRDMIVEGELAPGERISEKLLCERFGISRTPLREALKVLATEDLIELQPNRGARVAMITPDEIRERFEVLSSLERLAGELAVERASADAIAKLRALHARMKTHHNQGERHEYFQLNQQLHNAMIELADNAVLAATHENLMAKVQRPRFLALLSQERWDESVREHEAILDALQARNAELLGKLMAEHVRHTGKILRQVLDTDRERAVS